jgi:hypothetical protein
MHYGGSAISGAVAGAGLGYARPDIDWKMGALGGAVVGLAIGAMTRPMRVYGSPAGTETPPEVVGRKAVDQILAGQTDRWLNLAVWGPIMLWGGYKAPAKAGSVILTASGAVLIGTAAWDIWQTNRLRAQYEAAVAQKQAQMASQKAEVDALRQRIAQLQGRAA